MKTKPSKVANPTVVALQVNSTVRALKQFDQALKVGGVLRSTDVTAVSRSVRTLP